MSMQRRVASAWVVTLLASTVLAGCDALMTEPAAAPSDMNVSFAIEGSAGGGVAAAFDRVNRAYLLFTRADSAQRDTIVPVFNRDGVARVRLALPTNERIAALGVYAELRAGKVPLFAGKRIIRIQIGSATSAQIPLEPVPAAVRASRPAVTFANVGDTVRLSSAVLFASGDTIPGVTGAWTSENNQIVAVTPAGLALGRAVGETHLLVHFGQLVDTVPARVLAGR
jgi:hypothetical protein